MGCAPLISREPPPTVDDNNEAPYLLSGVWSRHCFVDGSVGETTPCADSLMTGLPPSPSAALPPPQSLPLPTFSEIPGVLSDSDEENGGTNDGLYGPVVSRRRPVRREDLARRLRKAVVEPSPEPRHDTTNSAGSPPVPLLPPALLAPRTSDEEDCNGSLLLQHM